MSIINKGFSLVELLVTIAIMGILSAVAIPSYQSMLKESYLSESISVMQQAIGNSKSYSIRNKFGKTNSQSVSRVCLNNSIVSVHVDSLSNAPSCSSDIIWSSEIKANIKVDNQNFACMCFNNKARITNFSTCNSSDDNCSTSNEMKFELTTGESREVEIF